VEFFDVAELPGAEHFADGVVDALLVGKNGGGRGFSVASFFFFFFCAEAVEASVRLRSRKREKKGRGLRRCGSLKGASRDSCSIHSPSLRRASVAD